MTETAMTFEHGGEPLTFGMVPYPGITLLDLVGPLAMLGPHGRALLLSKTLDPVKTDGDISINPTASFAECPEALDVLFVPGGPGTNAAMQDDELLGFVRRAGLRARYVTAVCTGSLVLGMAGLLDGYRAATHWAAYPALEAMGIEAVRERVVADRNRFTGGGVTAGIDFGLTLLAELRGVRVAELTQLLNEYDPKAAFNAGHPDVAAPELTQLVVDMGRTMNDRAVELARGRKPFPPRGGMTAGETLRRGELKQLRRLEIVAGTR